MRRVVGQPSGSFLLVVTTFLMEFQLLSFGGKKPGDQGILIVE
jgi:hypothetical protein